MLGSRLAAQLWQTSIYTNKACRAVGAPVCVFGAEALLLSFVSVHSGVCCVWLHEEHKCNCCGVQAAGPCVGGRSRTSEAWPGAAATWDGRTKVGERRFTPFVHANGHVVSKEDGPRPSLLSQGQTRRHEPWVPLEQMLQPRPGPVSFTLQIPQSSTVDDGAAQSEFNKIQMTD